MSQDHSNGQNETHASFEMLWDCQACGTKKLLGVTHRHCPHCGCPQKADDRYFPADGEEIKIANHIYCGADWSCVACGNPNNNKASYCGSCGCSRDGANSVHRKTQGATDLNHNQTEKSVGDTHATANKSAEKPKGPWIKTLLVVGIVSIMAYVFFPRKDSGVIEGHKWERILKIEHSVRKNQSIECSSVKPSMKILSQRTVSQEQKVQDGETCRDVCNKTKIDLGDGSFKIQNDCHPQCSPRIITKNVLISMCAIEYAEWQMKREVTKEGHSVDETLEWPEAKLSERSLTGYGEERLARKVEELTVIIDRKGKLEHCEISSFDVWKKFRIGDSVKLKSSVIGGRYCP
jgi:hypothetical protein